MNKPLAALRHSLRLKPLIHTLTCLLAAPLVLLATPQSSAAQTLPRDGLIMHLESIVGVQTKGDAVQFWWDQSGYGQNLRSKGRPKVVHNVLNGLPVIELDNNDKLRQHRPTSLPTFGNDRTVIVLSAPSHADAKIGYGAKTCGGSFLLQHDADGYSGMSTGCAGSIMHAQEQLTHGQWRLNASILSSGTLFHLLDGELVDGRSRNFETAAGPFLVELSGIARKGLKPGKNSQRLQIAAVLIYNWALGPNELQRVHRYLGKTYFNNRNRFARPPRLSPNALPAPKIKLTKNVLSKNKLQLDWRVSFADECGADNGWTRSRATSGSQRIRTFNTGASYGIHCWNKSASASADVALDLRLVRIHWQPNETEFAASGYKLLMGKRSKRYNRIIRVPQDPNNSHTLQLATGTYYIAMRALGKGGRESGLSKELTITVE